MSSSTRTRTSISPSTTTSSSSKKSHTHIAVDLSQSRTVAALESLCLMPKRLSKIKVASVFTSRASVGIHASIGTRGVEYIFGLLGKMVNLREVTVDLHYPHHSKGHGAFTLKALTCLFKNGGARRLQVLKLHQLQLQLQLQVDSTSPGVTPLTLEASMTSPAAQDFVKQLIMTDCKKHWRSISLDNCVGSGVGVLLALLAKHHHKYLRQVKVTMTPIVPPALALLTHKSSRLSSLILQDVPDLCDCQVMQLALDLQHSSSTQLKHLEIRSSILTEAAAEALTDMLWMNKTLQKLSLHLDCETLGMGMAQCFVANQYLKAVDLRCYGDDEAVSNSVVQIAQALQQNKSLTTLRICLEIEPYEYQQDIFEAFSKTLHNNSTLCQLELDDGIQKYPLPHTMQQQLQLNKSGYSKMIAADTPNTITKGDWVDVLAIGSNDNDITTVFTILMNCPILFEKNQGDNLTNFIDNANNGDDVEPDEDNVASILSFSKYLMASMSSSSSSLPSSPSPSGKKGAAIYKRFPITGRQTRTKTSIKKMFQLHQLRAPPYAA